LAGDGLLTEAFSVLASIQGVQPLGVVDILRDIAEAAGFIKRQARAPDLIPFSKPQ
jgi:hypothetical protein